MKETRSDSMNLKVGLESYKVEAAHGWFEFELEQPQPFIFTVWVEIDNVSNFEQLDQTIDYGLIQKCVDEVVLNSEEKIRLLESMAERIIQKLSLYPSASVIFVRIEKPEAPLPHPGGLPFIELVWQR